MLSADIPLRSQLITKSMWIEKARFPVIDAHSHLGEPFGGNWNKKSLLEMLDLMDEAGVVISIDLDGRWGEDILNAHLGQFKMKAPERFQVFGGVEWWQWESKGDGFPQWAADRLKIQNKRGVQGLKICKRFSLHVRDHEGELVKVDAPRLFPIWDMAGELDLPVMTHVADPVAFLTQSTKPMNASTNWERIPTGLLRAHPSRLL